MKIDVKAFHGVFVAMNSCYDSHGNINASAYKMLARHYMHVGVKGLYVGGSTGEGLLQEVAERQAVAEAVMEAVGDSMTVIVHVGAASTRHSVELAQHAERLGVHAVSAVPSVYYNISEKGVREHWTAIARSTSLPFILYHIPQTTRFELKAPLLTSMLTIDTVAGVKASSPSVSELQEFKAIGGDEFLIFNGSDEQYVAGRIMGADGGIGGTYGIMPDVYLAIDYCINRGDFEQARIWQYKANSIIRTLAGFPSLYAACKGVLTLAGFDCGTPRPPIEQLAETDWPRVKDLSITLKELTHGAKLLMRSE